MSGSPLLHGLFAESVFEFVVAEGVGRNVWVSLEDLEGVVERLENCVEGFAALGDGCGLA